MESNLVIKEAKEVLKQLLDAINSLTDEEYTQNIELLNASVGGHTRHIIELFQQLEKGYDFGIVNYDNRKRTFQIQEEVSFASDCILQIIKGLDKPNKPLKLMSMYAPASHVIDTFYDREILYNVEHAVHHQAMIKIAFLILEKKNLADDFGIAKATISYRKDVYS